MMTVPIEAIFNEVTFYAVRSRGPGGQNVNKVSSSALLVWDFRNSNHINWEQKNLIREKLAGRINADGHLHLRSDEFRDFEKNKSRCLKKLEEMLSRAWHKPKPRKATRPTRSSKIKKRDQKQRRGETKRGRQKVSPIDN
jgi:ribosome-associated protein